jgi:hypothetical protein
MSKIENGTGLCGNIAYCSPEVGIKKDIKDLKRKEWGYFLNHISSLFALRTKEVGEAMDRMIEIDSAISRKKSEIKLIKQAGCSPRH